MPKLSAHDIMILLSQISLLLFMAKVFGELCKKIKQPAVVGEIIAGVLMGPTVLGTLWPAAFSTLFLHSGNAGFALDGFIFIAVVLLLFVVGYEVDLKSIAREGRAVTWTSIMGVVVPLAIGFVAGWFVYPFLDLEITRFIFSSFFGVAMAISALPVIAKILFDLNLMKSRIGNLILATTTVNDLVAWLLFSVLISIASTNSEHGHSIWFTLGMTMLVIAATFTVLRWFFHWLLARVNRYSYPTLTYAVLVFFALVGAIVTEYIGIHAVFGAFLVGVAAGDTEHFRDEARHALQHFILGVLAPLFFVSIGLKVNFLQNFSLLFVLFVLAVAYVSKIAGGLLGGWIGKLSRQDAMAVGMGITARGGMGIILAVVAFEAGLVNAQLFAALVLMSVITSMTSGMYLRRMSPSSQGQFVSVETTHTTTTSV